MPNTLAHIAVQGIISKTAVPTVDLKWVYLGCVIPDIPWIMQRMVRAVAPHVDLVSLRYYADIQATLLFSLIACAAVALLVIHSGRTFVVLSANVAVHLLIDAVETKWGNGVHFFAPVSWELTSWDLIWPEHPLNVLVTIVGLSFIVWHWRRTVSVPPGLHRPPIIRSAVFVVLLLVYLLAPLFLLQGPARADNHFLTTRMVEAGRIGKPVEFDRARYQPISEGGTLQFVTDEPVSVVGIRLNRPGTVSAKGLFVTEELVQATHVHVHSDWYRDSASMIGLALIGLIWLHATLLHRALNSSAIK